MIAPQKITRKKKHQPHGASAGTMDAKDITHQAYSKMESASTAEQTNMTRHKRQEIEFYYRMGWQTSLITLCPIGTIVLVYTGHPELLIGFLGMCLALGLMNPVILGGQTMKTIKRLLGITLLNSKMEALAVHLKIKFKHIPEHHECVSTED